MSHDFDFRLTFDLDIGVKAQIGGYIFYASRKSDFYLLYYQRININKNVIEAVSIENNDLFMTHSIILWVEISRYQS